MPGLIHDAKHRDELMNNDVLDRNTNNFQLMSHDLLLLLKLMRIDDNRSPSLELSA